MIYIDLNMVRARVVKHPKEWMFTGYNEILSNRERYKLINKKKLQDLLNVNNEQMLKVFYKKQIIAALNKGNLKRESCWTESIAIGSREFVEKIKSELGIKAAHRKIIKNREIHELKESRISYIQNFTGEMSGLRVKITRNSD
jgi:putative transposase